MSLSFSAHTTRALLSVVAPFAPLPPAYLALPVVEPRRPSASSFGPAPIAVQPRAPRATRTRADEGWEEIELRPVGDARKGARAQACSAGGGGPDKGTTPVLLDATTSGFSARPAQHASAARPRFARAKPAAGAHTRDAPPSARAAEAVKTARTAILSRARRALNAVLPALGVQTRGGYARLRGRN
ncbi:uncharacterized protein B0H18DRAFT_1118390 [Fomitopsis serialis]|uniref:uncharacterized protein n=1 Tax=Fomitopsis serialis TaxID=139415 RepID=UPI00200858B9|nr:uncharacterized protein B0H18DRAFT_1118390 [Neoantrodia serialis]KAH9927583.1 hypothetical protein B0H18DRAFT_1118390 [Neoantrodia serialis]